LIIQDVNQKYFPKASFFTFFLYFGPFCGVSVELLHIFFLPFFAKNYQQTLFCQNTDVFL